MTQMIEMIGSCTSIDKFNNYLTSMTQQQQSTAIKQHFDDNELYSMITGFMKLVPPYDGKDKSLAKPNSVFVDTNRLMAIKKQIESCFLIIEQRNQTSTTNEDAPDPDVGGELNGHAISVGEHGSEPCSLFSLETSKWTTIRDVFNNRDQVSTAVVYARGDVYLFGGDCSKGDKPRYYSRYSLAEKKSYRYDIVGIYGGSNISTCYDGDNLIYLIGGYENINHMTDLPYNGNQLRRVDCFDITLQQFKNVGELDFEVTDVSSHFHNNLIYITGGGQGLFTFNVGTKETSILKKDIPGYYIRSCFDGYDKLYMLDHYDNFLQYSISTQHITNLSKLPLSTRVEKLLYDRYFGILFLGGKGNNYQYSIQENQWTLIKDDDPRNSRNWHGGCIIRD
ncbi:hypothetical protein SAMD00019534_024830 [Acytostelium subglobosum LB1]|uniref:hypothetical protein n=1 Tax=Acytostelium subglobosum LB1 TaxID=1410327 RepID=UPI000644B738|nr:hypothetical protein SAMD00019534_024830 [Acytostelium subglobosum LB1]GAM19308.1 hypothetical protein SAMD00019534_024830 [Acytostelium subglobosum LB1]|eukprot:XP_012757235.1 hypothetical protein SAMD00019534_024830 [Acytostelium subglobosum LB1]